MKNILVVRNDKIGDFMLAWPSFAMLKLSVPDMKVTALVPRYTAALAEMCHGLTMLSSTRVKKEAKRINRNSSQR